MVDVAPDTRKALEIPQDVLDDVVTALNMASALALLKEPVLHPAIIEAAIRLDEAINDALATEE